MFARSVKMRIKSNTLAEFNKTLEIGVDNKGVLRWVTPATRNLGGGSHNSLVGGASHNP
jgi:hypothetical protein